MRLLILTKRSLLTIGFCLLIGILAATVTISSTVQAVQTAASPKENPVYRVESDKNQVAISFDAAWGNEQTSELLDILDEYDVKSTFFLVGSWVDNYPESVKEIAKRGHDVENHSNTHPHMPELSTADMTGEIQACNEKIASLTGNTPTLFRPPYGDYNNEVVRSVKGCGMYCVQWDVDSLDWKDPTPEQMCKTVLDKVKDGSIILMHNGAKNTPAALPSIIRGIQDKGFDIVLIKDLIPDGEYYTDVQGELHLTEN
ncbi:MAG: polysaccharide deacetylase family protein [Ruminococcus sp.]|nr:polysaccharide deacetylase family protein [Ruminococcus sp.]